MFDLRLSAAVVCLVVCVVSFAPGASSTQSNEAKNESAQIVLEKALQALGGLERLKQIDSIYLKGKGSEFRSADVQGPDPDAPTRAFHEETVAVLPLQNKLLYEHRTGRHDGSFRWRRWMYAGEQRTVLDLRDDFISNVQRDPSAARERARFARIIPHLLLIEAANNSTQMQRAGDQVYAGKPHHVVIFPLPGTNIPLKLFFAADTHLLSKYEYTMDYAGLGDAVVEFVYTAYRRDAKVGWAPTGYKILLAGRTFREIEYTQIQFDSPQAAAAFEIPAQLASFIRPVGEVTEIADGVFILLNGSLNPMFVEFKDFILAIEAPAQAPTLERIPADLQQGSNQLTEAFIKKIKETIPNKPIRYLAVTHFHNDHAGGARAFMAEGATILTTAGNKNYFAKFGSRQPHPVAIETFDSRRVITDGQQTVELLNVGKSPHVNENVIAYLPRQKILFQGDLFYFNGMGQFPAKDPSRDNVMKFFGKWLLRNNLHPDRIYGFHDQGFATMTQVHQILRLRRATKNQ